MLTKESLAILSALLLACVQLSIWVSSSHRMRWMHESCAVLVLGTVVGLAAQFVAGAINFEVESHNFARVFFLVLFPPVIFNAGFTMRKRVFARNLWTILAFAVLGTLISTLIVGLLTFVLGRYAGVGSSDMIECLIYGGLISSTDSVSTIAVFLEMNVNPLLYSIVFGESVLNDAVAVAICRTLSKYVGQPITGITVWFVCRDFAVILVCSTLIGIAVGYLWVGVRTYSSCSV
eukprot:m51a1_g4380 putative sodium hydrogen exchanger 3 (234) ;mRNA; r:332269-333024